MILKSLAPRLAHARHWMRQPSSVIGLMSVVGGATAAYLGDAASSWAPMIAAGVCGLVIPDNTARNAPQRFVTDALQAVALHRVPQDLPTLVAEGQEAVQSMTKTTTTPLPSGDAVLVDTQTTTLVPTPAGMAQPEATISVSGVPVLGIADAPQDGN